ncbi:MAG: CapA family protein [Lachnospiraceae bacterium]|nr:CapA family protein [Lachnospiraceae bacterium]
MDNRNLKVFGITLAICLVLGAAVLGTVAVLKGSWTGEKTSNGNSAESGELKSVSLSVEGWEDLNPDRSTEGEKDPAGQDSDLPPGAERIDVSKETATEESGTIAETEEGEKLPPAGTKLKDEKGRVTEVILPENEEITMLFAGDILFDDNFTPMVVLRNRGQGILGSFSDATIDEMRAADIFVINNEFPYSDRGAPLPNKNFTFRAKPETVTFLDDIGVDMVTLANNHAYDFGEEALLDTFTILNNDEMPYAGAGENLSEAVKEMVFRNGDQSIAVLSATQIERMPNPDTKGATESSAGVFRCLDDTRLVERVAEANELYDIVVVYVHWGTESTTVLDYRQVDSAKRLADAGADLIIGDHPHILQSIDIVGGCPVIYSLGNYWFNSSAQDSCLVKATLSGGRVTAWQFLPARQEGCFTSLLDGAEKDRVLAHMREISPNVSIDADGYLSLNR